MPGTRTAPTIDGNTTFDTISLSLIDADKGEITDTIKIDSATTLVQAEAIAAALQAASNASLWKVQISETYVGAKLSTNAAADDIVSVFDQIGVSWKEPSVGAYIDAHIPAPLGAIVLPGGVPDVTNGLYSTWRDAVNAVMLANFDYLNARFTQNVRRNQAVSPT